MKHTVNHHLRSIAVLSGVLFIVLSGTYAQSSTSASSLTLGTWSAALGSSQIFTEIEQRSLPQAVTLESRIALRLQKRLRSKGSRASPPLERLTEAVQVRQVLLARYSDVVIQPEGRKALDPWKISPQRYPLWIVPRFSLTEASFQISTEAIKETLERESIPDLNPPINAVLTAIVERKNEKSATRVAVDGVAKPGYLLETEIIAASVAKALEEGVASISVAVPVTNGRIINMTGLDLGSLTLLAGGRSNFKGSESGRIANVKKAINEHVNNVIVVPGESYSFNAALDGPVSQGNGWHMAKVIYNGGDLEYAPGGGICQASTTVFRAAILAGLPIIKRKAHSLYVTYYKQYGIGIDATIYPGSQDLVFDNDTPGHLLIQSYNEGDDAFVNFYGTPDGRTVKLSGPYFASTAPEGLTYNGRLIAKTEILWVQNVAYANGESREYKISSRYKELPQLSLAREFPPEQVVHASAPVERDSLGMR